MRVVGRLLVFAALSIVSASALPVGPAQTPTSVFRLFFIGHEIGQEADTVTATPTGRHLEADFKFVDRGTTVSLAGSLDLTPSGQATHFVVKGRNYRLFTSDSEVSVTAGRAHVRDLMDERDVDAKAPFFPEDSYAPIGFQEELIKYWLAHGRPTEIDAPPAGRIRIAALTTEIIDVAGAISQISSPSKYIRLSISGLVWGTEMALFDVTRDRLLAIVTWAGALPFEAILEGQERSRDWLIARAADDRVFEFRTVSKSLTPRAQGGTANSAFALIGATVVSASGAEPLADAAVEVRSGRIQFVGPARDYAPASEVVRIDARGEFIIPGLWDMHAHASQTDWALPYLAGGVTTIRDMGGELSFLTEFRDAVASGAALGPRILLAGLIDGPGPAAFGMVTADTPGEAKQIVQRYHGKAFDQIKIYDGVAPDIVRVITEEAHRLGMTVTGHVPRGMTARSAVEAGFDQLAHLRISGQPGSAAVAEQVEFYKAHGTVMDPTVSWNELSGHAAATPISSFLPGVDRLPLTLRRTFASMTASNGSPDAIHARLLQSLQLVHEAQQAGVPVVAGTDKGVPGFSVQRELELYVEGGMTPLEAIQSATIVPARVMKLEKDTGTIEVGKRADLIILSANPLEKIANIRTAKFVVANGRLYECAALWKAAGYQ